METFAKITDINKKSYSPTEPSEVTLSERERLKAKSLEY